MTKIQPLSWLSYKRVRPLCGCPSGVATGQQDHTLEPLRQLLEDVLRSATGPYRRTCPVTREEWTVDGAATGRYGIRRCRTPCCLVFGASTVANYQPRFFPVSAGQGCQRSSCRLFRVPNLGREFFGGRQRAVGSPKPECTGACQSCMVRGRSLLIPLWEVKGSSFRSVPPFGPVAQLGLLGCPGRTVQKATLRAWSGHRCRVCPACPLQHTLLPHCKDGQPRGRHTCGVFGSAGLTWLFSGVRSVKERAGRGLQ